MEQVVIPCLNRPILIGVFVIKYTNMADKKRFMIIDGNALLHRAFHALPPLATKHGILVNAVYGFTTVLMKALKELKPDYAAVAFDVAGGTFRDEMYEEYKAGRAKQPDELYDQIPMIKDVVRAFKIPVVEKQGFEADDVIATLVGYSKFKNIIVTGDKDALQLVDENTKVYGFRKGMSDMVIYDEKAVKERYGFEPEQMIDFKALAGDPSDNIPGVKGVGEKTATMLIQEFGTIEGLYEKVKTDPRIEEKIKPRIVKLLLEYEKDAKLGKELVVLRQDVKINADIEDCKIEQPDYEKLRELFEGFEFKGLVKRVDELADKGQRAKGQGTLLGGQGIRENKEIEIAAYLLNAGDRNYTLESVAQEYGMKDAEKLMDKLREDLKKQNLLQLFEKIELPLMPVLREMEKTGIKVDTEYLQKLSARFTEQLKTLEKKIYQQSGQEFNINSPVQLREILFDKLQLTPQSGRIKKTAKGGVASTAAGELEKLRGAHPIIDLVFEYRELAKLNSTYTYALIDLVDKKDGRLRTTFHQTITATGRLSSSNPNLQNIPIRTENGRQIRKAFIAEPGYVLLSADYSQIELRVAASLSNDPEMIKAFKSGHDFHAETAARVFGVDAKKIDHEMRRKAKAINFGIIYGMGATALARSTDMSRSDAQQFIERYFEVFNTLYAFLKACREQAHKKGYVQTLFGRRRYIPDIDSGVQQVRAAAERMALNHPIQGSSADLMKMAMIQIHQELAPIRMLLQVHDELVFEIKENAVREITPKIKEIMENIHQLKVPIEVEIKIGKNWGEMKNIV